MVSIFLALLAIMIIRHIWHPVIWHGPDSNEVQGQVFQRLDKTCYKMRAVPYVCPRSQRF
jgi:hypothetical protein